MGPIERGPIERGRMKRGHVVIAPPCPLHAVRHRMNDKFCMPFLWMPFLWFRKNKRQVGEQLLKVVEKLLKVVETIRFFWDLNVYVILSSS